MKLYTIIVGIGKDRDEQRILKGERLDIRFRIEKKLLERHGGYTILESSGGWMDGSNVVKEPGLTILVVDGEDDSKITKTALDVCSFARQSTVCVIYAGGHTVFLPWVRGDKA